MWPSRINSNPKRLWAYVLSAHAILGTLKAITSHGEWMSQQGPVPVHLLSSILGHIGRIGLAFTKAVVISGCAILLVANVSSMDNFSKADRLRYYRVVLPGCSILAICQGLLNWPLNWQDNSPRDIELMRWFGAIYLLGLTGYWMSCWHPGPTENEDPDTTT